MSEPALKIPARLSGDPRIVTSAKLLGITKAHFYGNVLHLFSQAVDYAEDGDLWRGDEDSSIRFTAALAGWEGEAPAFVFTLQQEGWIVEWMIADWLDIHGENLYRKYKSNSREKLVNIHAKNGRVYGRGRGSDRPDTSQTHPMGYIRDMNGLKKKHPITPNPIALIPIPPNESESIKDPTTLNPTTQGKKEIKTPEGGVGEEESSGKVIRVDQGFFLNFSKEGLLAQGIVLTQDQLDGSGLNYVEVYGAFKPVFVFHSLPTVEAFYFRCTKCGCTPAWWTMVFMDKAHAVYRERPEGTPWLENGADPVAMTMAATLPSYGRRHSPTEAARQLFLEIMIDYQRHLNGESARWAGSVTGRLIAKELDLRKGKAGKIA